MTRPLVRHTGQDHHEVIEKRVVEIRQLRPHDRFDLILAPVRPPGTDLRSNANKGLEQLRLLLELSKMPRANDNSRSSRLSPDSAASA
jgi:hypothetical protein